MPLSRSCSRRLLGFSIPASRPPMKIETRLKPDTCSLSRRILAVVAVLAIGTPILVARPNGDLDDSNSSLKPLITKYAADRTSLAEMYDDPFSEVRRTRFRKF